MNRKLDLAALLLFTALLFGAVVRFYPAITSGFPLNDGGMFYTMTQDLKANGFSLPHFTTYNNADIPFAYPPLGLYAAALLSTLLPGSDLGIFLHLPAVINLLSIAAFYLFAKEILGSRTTAAIATLIYALTPRAFLWQVMGGGITRAFGVLFLFLMLWKAAQLFKEYHHTRLALVILFGAGAVTSHPQAALHTALGGALVFLFFGANKRGLISAMIVGAGVALLSAPWWGTVLANHGIAPLLSAGQSSPRTVESYLDLIRLDGLGEYLFLPTLLLALVGMFTVLKQRSFFLPTWIVLAVLVDPRGGEGVAISALILLAGAGVVKLSAWIQRPQEEQVDRLMMRRGSLNLLFGFMLWLFIPAMIADFQLVNTSLKQGELEVIAWVNENVEEGAAFALAAGREFSMSDPLQEWFPALTGRKSLTTMQGLEWTLAEGFFPWYGQLQAFQHCAEISCAEEWSVENDAAYDYLIILLPDENDHGGLAESLKSLGVSARSSDSHMLVFESDHALIFKVRE
jgi:hypothetical protein